MKITIKKRKKLKNKGKKERKTNKIHKKLIKSYQAIKNRIIDNLIMRYQLVIKIKF
ncbi:hypothetical protein O185_07825 [Photorhabdus temperata J3]|uniref:Uncharacterized protein n=1 Tax=Photorhabdus temperata J3 TaxID=1389415 RepID=U7R2N3_PHOTE|nr:hypothetical protein O185_07825 [Photorhabdus temperata J3]